MGDHSFSDQCPGVANALVIKNLRKDNFDLPLDLTQVAVGNSIGSRGSNYIKGRVDKACLQVVGDLTGAECGRRSGRGE